MVISHVLKGVTDLILVALPNVFELVGVPDNIDSVDHSLN
jgi:hypothetical protein